MNFIVYGNKDSPVIPIILYQPGKVAVLSRVLLERGIAVVIAGYPATPINEARCRVCLSASHTREMIDFALKEIEEIGLALGIQK
jgi:serine palmitoyltransferase